MVGIVIVSHGSLAQGLGEAAEMILGKQEYMTTLSLEPADGLDSLKAAIQLAAEQVNGGQGVLVLADVRGGTPCNAAALIAYNLELALVTGVNLPMLLEVLTRRRNIELADLVEVAVMAGREGIVDLSALMPRANSGSR